MAILALDTTTVVATAAIVRQGYVLAEVALGVQRNHAERILPAIDFIMREAGLKPSQLARVAVCIGPGSFTGQRIGLSLAKGLAEGLGIPLVPVSTLKLLAEQLSMFEGIVVPLLDAQRNEYYGAVFRSRGGVVERLVADQTFNRQELGSLLSNYSGEPVMLTGEAAEEAGLKQSLRVAPPPWRMPRASVLGLLAENTQGVDSKAVIPNYIRSSSAKPRKNGE
ncbi:MAG: tRNA (adenosine(37)-N6)-threonylcarbamoyltransferase complex dimerization subunit type 1 TsaB [Peptococcaceae bacterium]|nr:tRNA (adenosine(37)-N6)-threonylcarbamoyltransferase complex dimerization subunit type 1 TsaB [Peptococcaceae bacterium]